MIPKSKLITAPSESVVSLNEVKQFLRIDSNDDDTLLEVLIDSSTIRLEEEICMKFISQEWEIYYDNFGNHNSSYNYSEPLFAQSSLTNHLSLPFGKVIQIDSISTFDNDDVEYIVPATAYQADTIGLNAKVSLRYGEIWPATILRPSNGIKVSGLFGISNNAVNVPKHIKMAVMELVAAMYEYRGDEFPKIPATALMLIEPYRRFKIGCR